MESGGAMQGVCRNRKWKAMESMDNKKSISLRAVQVYGRKRDKKGGNKEQALKDGRIQLILNLLMVLVRL